MYPYRLVSLVISMGMFASAQVSADPVSQPVPSTLIGSVKLSMPDSQTSLSVVGVNPSLGLPALLVNATELDRAGVLRLTSTGKDSWKISAGNGSEVLKLGKVPVGAGRAPQLYRGELLVPDRIFNKLGCELIAPEGYLHVAVTVRCGDSQLYLERLPVL